MDSKMFQLDQMDQFGLEPADMDTFNMTAVNPEELLQLDSACPSLFGGLMQFDSNNKHNNSDSSPCQSPDGPVFRAFEGLNFCNNLSINTNYLLQRGNAAGSCDSINDTDTNSNISPAGSEDLRKSNSCNSSEATQDHKKVAIRDVFKNYKNLLMALIYLCQTSTVISSFTVTCILCINIIRYACDNIERTALFLHGKQLLWFHH